jgi:hypothetical protein
MGPWSRIGLARRRAARSRALGTSPAPKRGAPAMTDADDAMNELLAAQREWAEAQAGENPERMGRRTSVAIWRSKRHSKLASR